MANTESDLIKKFHDEWCIANGYKLHAASFKPQAKQVSAASVKPQAASFKRQAASDKLINFKSLIKFYASSSERFD